MKKYYGAINGLRTLSAFGIVMMHVASNNNYQITGGIYENIIPSFTNLVFLFMEISAFSMCCGYYKKLMSNNINLSEFYKKRFMKTLPFFGFLVLLDIVITPSKAALYEAFADLTLIFGFLPNPGNISVIGVGWFLGLLFVFYLCFPFFCVLLETPKRAWLSFIISLLYNFSCINYFYVGRSNILYSACFFIAGGLIYVYREHLENFNKKALIFTILISVIIYYSVGGDTITCLLVSSSLLIYAIASNGGILENSITNFFSNISLEIYLSHMAVFRVLEKLKINTIIGNGWIQYIITVFLTLLGSSTLAVIVKKIGTLIVKRKKALNVHLFSKDKSI